MILIVNNPSCKCEKNSIEIESKPVNYDESDHCRLLQTEKNRKRPSKCHNYHPQEKDIRQCGGTGTNRPTIPWLQMLSSLFALILTNVWSRQHHFRITQSIT